MTGMTAQGVLAWLGALALAGGAVSLAMAARTYFRLDIRAVRADLSGRRRAEEVGRPGREPPAASERGPGAAGPAPPPVADVGEGCVPAVACVLHDTTFPAVARAPDEVPSEAFRVTRRIVCVSSDEVIGEA